MHHYSSISSWILSCITNQMVPMDLSGRELGNFPYLLVRDPYNCARTWNDPGINLHGFLAHPYCPGAKHECQPQKQTHNFQRVLIPGEDLLIQRFLSLASVPSAWIGYTTADSVLRTSCARRFDNWIPYRDSPARPCWCRLCLSTLLQRGNM